MLQLPYSVAQMGWTGLAVLVAVGIAAVYTCIKIVACIHPPGYKTVLLSYGDIGAAALGRHGRWFVDLQQHATLIGVATVYLILAGLNLHSLFSWVSSVNIGILLAAATVWPHVFLGTLKEVGVLSAFNVLVAVSIAVFAILEVFIGGADDDPPWSLLRTDMDWFQGFVSMMFAFGVHVLIPSIYSEMREQERFRTMITGAFSSILGLYVPLCIAAYYAYGENVSSPLYDSWTNGWGTTSLIVAVTAHVLMSFPVVLYGTHRAVESRLGIRRLPLRVVSRTFVMSLALGLALAVPSFPILLTLVASITNTMTCFILPCLFYVSLYRDIIAWPELLACVVIIIAALLAAAFGGYAAVRDAIDVWG